MKRLVIFAAVLSLLSLETTAQKQANIWYFGYRMGFDFNAGYPQVLNDGAMFAEEGTAVAAEPQTGQLLFYTNGLNIWNRKHRIMEGSLSSCSYPCSMREYQAALIVPVPNTARRYYLFAIPTVSATDSATLFYSIIDMNGDSGDGAVIESAVELQRNVTYKMTAVLHANGRDYWLIAHAYNSNAFLVYPIAASGIGKPKQHFVGARHESTVIGGFVSDWDRRGVIKASPNGRKLAVTIQQPFNQITRPFELFDFDPSTGTVSNPVVLSELSWQAGVSFSTDNTKLYVQADKLNSGENRNQQRSTVFQYDLTASSAEAVSASAVSIIVENPRLNDSPNTFASNFMLQLAPDGKIYAPFPTNPPPSDPRFARFIVINQPNRKGIDCNAQAVNFTFANGASYFGLPNFIESVFNGLAPDTTGDCSQPAVAISPNPSANRFRVRANTCFGLYRLKVYNLLGQLLIEKNIGTTLYEEVTLDAFADGVYFFVLQNSTGVTLTKRVVKQSA